ncbi:MAG: tetratricopeptide repeat protein [Geitlerinemataceae cyanobacterium]
MIQKALLDTAIDYHKAGNFTQAELLYRQILQDNPEDAEALHGLGAVAYQMGAYDRALEWVQKAIDLSPKNSVFYNTAGMAYRALGNSQAAAKNYVRAVALDLENTDVQRNFNRAISDLIIVNSSAAIANLATVANLYHQSENLAQAQHLYRQIVQFNPHHAEALHHLGIISYQQERYPEAIDLLCRAIELEANNSHYHHNLGLAYEADNQTQLASQSYRRALELDPKNTVIIESLDRAFSALIQEQAEAGKAEMLKAARESHFNGHLDAAKILYTELFKRDRNYTEALHGLGVVLHQQSQHETAIAYLHQVLKLVPNNYHAHNNLGLVYQDDGQYVEAIESYKQALKLKPGHEAIAANLKKAIEKAQEYYHEISQIYVNAGNPERAAQLDFEAGQFVKEHTGNVQVQARYYRRAIETNPVHAEAHHALAELYLLQNQPETAIGFCRQAIQSRSNFALAYKTLGNAFVTQKNYDAALQAYSQALTHQPNFAEVYSNIAGVYFLQNQLDNAIATYQKALSLDNTLPAIYWNFGKVLERQNKLNETIACWQKALELQSDYGGAIAQYQFGAKLLAAGKRDDAIRRYQKAIELQPDFVDANWDLCEILGLQNYPAARSISQRFCENVRDPKQVLALLAKLKSHLNSGISPIARDTFLELENNVYQYLPQINPRDTIRLYLNLMFDAPHIRDDIAANAKLTRTLAQRFVALLDRKVQSENIQPPTYSFAQPHSPLRIGFISQHFRRHSVGWLSVETIENLSKITPHIHLYVTGNMNTDEITQRFKGAATKFHHPQAFIAGDLSREIGQDNLDVLVDLDSVTVMMNTEILHRRPAPLCLSWLGFDAPYLTEKNYYLGDWYTHPQGVESYYLEKVARLPHSFAAVSSLPIRPIDRQLLRKASRIAPNQIAYLCVATGNKYCQEMVQAQIAILKRVPDSILFYKARVGDLEAIGQIYHEECTRQGVRTNRVKMLSRTPTEEEHRLIYQFADILIDSYPYSGATHVVEALCFNMPVVARVSQQSFGRQAYSLLKNAGTDMGIAWTWDEYIDWAVRLGKNAQLRKEMRSQLERGKHPNSLAPLWNPPQFARQMYGILKDLCHQVV